MPNNLIEIEQKLNDYKNKSWLINTRVHKIMNFSISDKETFIATDKDILKYKNGVVLKKVAEFLPVSNEAVIEFKGGENFPTLETSILGMIEKLKGDDGEKFIKQSAAINSSVKTMVEIGKLQLNIDKHKKGV